MFPNSKGIFRAFLISLAVTVSSGNAQSITNQELVLNCLATIGEGTNWQECRGMMFVPCQEHKIGTDTHVACLAGEKQNWENTMSDMQEALLVKLTPTGNNTLAELMRDWFEFRDTRCNDVAEARPSAARSARLGCEITEIAGITAEFQACLEGRSTTQYCMFKES